MTKQLPREILEKAVTLRDYLKQIYLVLYFYGKPVSSLEVARKVGKARAHVSMRLNQLEVMGLIKREKEGRTVKWKVIE